MCARAAGQSRKVEAEGVLFFLISLALIVMRPTVFPQTVFVTDPSRA